MEIAWFLDCKRKKRFTITVNYSQKTYDFSNCYLDISLYADNSYLSIFMHTSPSPSDDFGMLMMFFFKEIIPKEITFILQYLAVLSYTPTVPFASA